MKMKTGTGPKKIRTDPYKPKEYLTQLHYIVLNSIILGFLLTTLLIYILGHIHNLIHPEEAVKFTNSPQGIITTIILIAAIIMSIICIFGTLKSIKRNLIYGEWYHTVFVPIKTECDRLQEEMQDMVVDGTMVPDEEGNYTLTVIDNSGKSKSLHYNVNDLIDAYLDENTTNKDHSSE